jgi:hypothetical protein
VEGHLDRLSLTCTRLTSFNGASIRLDQRHVGQAESESL